MDAAVHVWLNVLLHLTFGGSPTAPKKVFSDPRKNRRQKIGGPETDPLPPRGQQARTPLPQPKACAAGGGPVLTDRCRWAKPKQSPAAAAGGQGVANQRGLPHGPPLSVSSARGGFGGPRRRQPPPSREGSSAKPGPKSGGGRRQSLATESPGQLGSRRKQAQNQEKLEAPLRPAAPRKAAERRGVGGWGKGG